MYTMEDWRRDGTFNASPGQEISEEIYNEMFNALPPLNLPRNTAEYALEKLNVPVHAGFMMGEPYESNAKDGILFLAFGMNDYGKGKHFFYLGLGHKDKPVKNGTYYFFESVEGLQDDGLVKASKDIDDVKAIRFAQEREATAYKLTYWQGNVTSKETLYVPMFQ